MFYEPPRLSPIKGVWGYVMMCVWNIVRSTLKTFPTLNASGSLVQVMLVRFKWVFFLWFQLPGLSLVVKGGKVFILFYIVRSSNSWFALAHGFQARGIVRPWFSYRVMVLTVLVSSIMNGIPKVFLFVLFTIHIITWYL